MAEANWYWAEGENRNGPVTPSAIARLVADGTLRVDDLIWKEGMADWITVSKVPALARYVRKPAGVALSAEAANSVAPVERVSKATTPSAVVEPVHEAVQDSDAQKISESVDMNALAGEVSFASVGYYNPTSNLPARAAATLAKHAAPRGDTGDWPLDDPHVAQFDEAVKLRKRIDSAALLFYILIYLGLIGTVFVGLGAAGFIVGSRGGPGAVAGVALATTPGLCLGLTILYFFAHQATVRSRRWAPLTIGILCLIGVLIYVVQAVLNQIAVSNSSKSNAVPGLIANAFAIFLCSLFAWMSFRAFFAIPKYLLTPAWCQELLSKTSKR